MNTPKINDGGPAFPVHPQNSGQPTGLSLRDWFAGMALNETELKCVQLQFEAAYPDSKATYTLAEARFFHADAMLAQRNKK